MERQTVPIRIGTRVVTTTPETAAQIVADPARLLQLYEMMREAGQRLYPYRPDPSIFNRLRQYFEPDE